MPEHPRPIIVGIDPGTTTALAVLDTRGRPLSIKSKKGFSKAEVSKHICRFGTPVLIAADRRPMPAKVEKLASVFSARLVVPEENLSRRDKNLLARELDREIPHTTNRHERDALASAVYAYNAIRPTMKRVEQRLKALGHSGNKGLENFVKTSVILKNDHVKRAIDKFFKEFER